MRLRALVRREARGRLLLGRLASTFLARHAHQELGFARIGDYARERLGISTSHFYEVAHVCTSLSWLPEVARAVEAGDLCWSKAREIVTVALPETQAAWLALAGEHTADELHALVAHVRQEAARASSSTGDGDAAAGVDSRERGVEHHHEEDEIDGEPAVTVVLRCPPFVRLLWWEVLRLSCKVAGTDLAAWQSAEVIAAEHLSSCGWLTSVMHGTVQGRPPEKRSVG